MERVASAWVGQPATAASLVTLDDADQWTVQGSFRAQRPLRKFSWPNGEQVYVSQSSGEVVQYTTTASRIGAYLGPIPHWIYFTPLRKHQPAWSQLGHLVVGHRHRRRDPRPRRRRLDVFAVEAIPRRRRGDQHPVSRAEAVARHPGLFFGLGAVTWAFSGMLSMDPFP